MDAAMECYMFNENMMWMTGLNGVQIPEQTQWSAVLSIRGAHLAVLAGYRVMKRMLASGLMAVCRIDVTMHGLAVVLTQSDGVGLNVSYAIFAADTPFAHIAYEVRRRVPKVCTWILPPSPRQEMRARRHAVLAMMPESCIIDGEHIARYESSYGLNDGHRDWISCFESGALQGFSMDSAIRSDGVRTFAVVALTAADWRDIRRNGEKYANFNTFWIKNVTTQPPSLF